MSVGLETEEFFLNNEKHETIRKNFMEEALTARMCRTSHEFFSCLFVVKKALRIKYWPDRVDRVGKCDFGRSSSVQSSDIGQLAKIFIGIHATTDKISVRHLESAPVRMPCGKGTRTDFFGQNTAANRECSSAGQIFRDFTEGQASIQDAIDEQ